MNDHERAKEALSYVDAGCRRQPWFEILASLKSLLGEDGKDLGEEWSQTAPDSYDRSAFEITWRSIEETGGIGPGTLFARAKENGYVPSNGHRAMPSPEDLARRQAAKERAEREAAERAETGKVHARAIWNAGDRGPTAYTKRKGMQEIPRGLKRIHADALSGLLGYAPKVAEQPLQGECVIVPIKVNGELSSVELIDETGKKWALYGAKRQGGYWSPDALPVGDGEGLTIVVAEGMATAWSAHEAGYPTVAAFACHNLKPVAQTMRAKYPKARIIVLSDIGNGESDAREAAALVGGLVATPDFGSSRNEGDKDMNDLHQRKGLEAVRQCVEAAQAPQTSEPVSQGQPPHENASAPRLDGGWDEPEPIGRTDKAEPYPLDEWPGTVGAAIREVIHASQVPPALAAHGALCAMSTAAMGLADIKRAETLVGPIGIFALILCESGERKSHVDRLFMAGIEQWQSEQVESQRLAYRQYLTEREIWEAKRDGLKSRIKRLVERGPQQEGKTK